MTSPCRKEKGEYSMTVHELTRDQLIELKQHILCEQGSPSCGELADADELIPDETVFAEFDATDFTEDDFFCMVGQ